MQTVLNSVFMKAPSCEPAPRSAEKTEPPTIESSELLAGHRQLIIQHGSERYRLLVTRSNKLILTK
jgi:hemin uptake protein HemP